MHIELAIKSSQHNNRTPLIKFSPEEDIIAIASGSITTIYSSDASVLDEIDTEGHPVLDLKWASTGEYLAVLSENTNLVILWVTARKRQIKLTLDVSDPLSIDWSYQTKQLAIGTGQGHIFTYDAFTSARVPYMSKHQRKIYSICYSMQSDYIASLSSEAFILSDNQGQTLAYLREKSTGCIFLGRMISCEIRTSNSEMHDVMVVPVYANPQLVKRAKSFSNVENPSIYLIILNVDKKYISDEFKGQAIDLMPNLSNYTYGNYFSELWTENEADTLIDMKYMPGTDENPNELVCLMSSGNIFNVSLDHSREDLKVQMNLDENFKYGTIIERRSEEFVSESFMSYQAYLEDMNTQFGLTENTNGASQFNIIVLRSLCPTTSSSLLQVVAKQPKFIVPFEKSFTITDISSGASVEKMFIDFTGGKNSLGVVTNFPTNFAYSLASASVAAVSFSNGSTMIILTRSSSNEIMSIIEDTLAYPSSLSMEKIEYSFSEPGMNILNQQSPKVLQLSKLIPCRYSIPAIINYSNEISIPSEPQCIAISTSSFGFTIGNKIMWSSIKYDEEKELVIDYRESQQMNIKQLQLISISGFEIAAVRTTDGQIALHAGGGVTSIIELPDNSKIQEMASCAPLLYCLTERSRLLIYNIDAEEQKIYYNLIADHEFDEEFNSQSQATTTMLALIPGGIGCMVYRENEPSNPAVYLPVEQVSFEDIFKEKVAISRVLFDTTLVGLFVAFNSEKKGDQIISNMNYTGSINMQMADEDGPGLITQKFNCMTHEVSALPNVLSNGVALLVANGILEEQDPIKGISNLHQAITSLVYQEPPLSANSTNYIQYASQITPVEASCVTLIPNSNNQATTQLLAHQTEFRPLPHPSQLQVYSKAALELCNFGFTELALQFAARLQRADIYKPVGDCALRFGDMDTATIAFGELSLLQQTSDDYNDEVNDYLKFVTGDTAERQDVFVSLDRVPFLQNMGRKRDPAAISLFLNRICMQEFDINTTLAYCLLISCPDLEKFPKQAESCLDNAERLLLKSNRPGLALSFRVDSLDWETASNLAKKISSPLIRSQILIQQAGEAESKQFYGEAIEICQQIALKDGKFDLSQVPRQIQPDFIGILARCFCFQGKTQQCRELALPPKVNGKYTLSAKDPLNVMQRARLCCECADQLCYQKKYADAAAFYEAAAHLSGRTFKRLTKEIAELNSGELSLEEIATGGQADAMLLFQLLPALRVKCKTNYELFATEQNQYDIQLLKQLDSQAEETEKRIQQSMLPETLGQVVSPGDLAELDFSALLSKAANAYIKAREYAAAEALIDYVSDKNTIADLARVFMRDDPEKALALFRKAGKSLEIVQCFLQLKKVKEAEAAVREVQQQLCILRGQRRPGTEAQLLDMEGEFRESSLILAQFYKRQGAAQKAVYFFVMGEGFDEAFDLAVATQNEPILIKYVTSKAPAEFLKRAAKFFAQPDKETKKPRNLPAAAKFLELSGSVENAIKLLLNYGNGAGDIDEAILLVKQCKKMIDYVLKYLQGGADGVKKNPIYIFKLYLALEKYNEAAKTAFVLADRQIMAQKYQSAKQLLVTCKQQIFRQTGHSPQKFRDLLTLLFSVDVGRKFAQKQMHQQAAMCLFRAAGVASRFGEAASNILISACVECSRCPQFYYQQAYMCACVLLKEYSDEIPDKYRKPIEMIVRKHKKEQKSEISYLNCCQCQEPVEAGKLTCDNCHAILPLDAATGSQITLADYCECPYCAWPCSRLGLYEVYNTEEIKAVQTQCLMCGKNIDLTSILLVDNENFELISSGKYNYEHYENRPLIGYQDSAIARKRYEEWVKMWQSEQQEEENEDDI